tara:strand:+ start:59 stop:238 length:180 start_codon:yes stop_codon:yes gene_type:complete
VEFESGATTVIYETAELIEAPNWTSDGDWLIFNEMAGFFEFHRMDNEDRSESIPFFQRV